MKFKRVGGTRLYGWAFRCPGCDNYHVVRADGTWTFNEDFEQPTLSPSVLITETKTTDGRLVIPRCHSFIRDGRIEFLGDCSHALAGQTVELPELPTEDL